MKETKKMLEYYKTMVKINSVAMVVFIIMFIIAAVYMLAIAPQNWWVSLILFVLAVLSGILFYYSNKATKKRINALEKEIAEAEKSKSE